MSWLDRLLSSWRTPPVLALPGPVVGGRPHPVDADPTRTQLVECRADSSLYNPLTQMGGGLDKTSAAVPVRAPLLTGDQLQALHVHNALSRRIVEIIPKRATAKGWTIPELGDEEQRLDIASKLREAWIWGRLYGGGGLLMVTEDDVPASFGMRSDRNAWRREPLDVQRVGRIVALHVFDGRSMSPVEYDRDIRSPDFRKPSIWHLNSEEWVGEVHASRLLFFGGATVDPSHRIYGRVPDLDLPTISVLQHAWDQIRHLTETAASGAKLAQEISQAVFKVEGFGEIASGSDRPAFTNRMRFMNAARGIWNALVMGSKDSYELHNQSVSGFGELPEGARLMVSMATGIPEQELFHTTPAGLNADGDAGKESWRQTLQDEQEGIRPQIERLGLVLLAAQDGPTGGRVPDYPERRATFHPLDEPSAMEEAQARVLHAEADAKWIEIGAMTGAHVARSRFGPNGYSDDLLPFDPAELERQEPEPATDPSLRSSGDGSGEGDDGEGQSGDRADAADREAWVSIPAPAPSAELLAAVEAAAGQPLQAHPTRPHITVLITGAELGAARTREASRALDAIAERHRAGGVASYPRLALFPVPSGSVAVVLEYDAHELHELHHATLTRLAHLVRQRQHDRYRPHLTLGYLPTEPSPEAQARLLALELPDAATVAVSTLELHAGPELVHRVTLGG